MKPVQSRMARAALKIGIREIADAAKVSTQTITRLEKGEELRDRTIDDIRRAYEDAGVRFVEDGEWAGTMVRLDISAQKSGGTGFDVDENQVVQYPENLENDAPPGAGG